MARVQFLRQEKGLETYYERWILETIEPGKSYEALITSINIFLVEGIRDGMIEKLLGQIILIN